MPKGNLVFWPHSTRTSDTNSVVQNNLTKDTEEKKLYNMNCILDNSLHSATREQRMVLITISIIKVLFQFDK